MHKLCAGLHNEKPGTRPTDISAVCMFVLLVYRGGGHLNAALPTNQFIVTRSAKSNSRKQEHWLLIPNHRSHLTQFVHVPMKITFLKSALQVKNFGKPTQLV